MDELQTRRQNRNELAEFLPSPRLIKAFENLQADVATVIPAAVDANSAAIAQVGVMVDNAQASATSAQGAADAVLRELRTLTALMLTQRSLASDVARLQRQVDELRTLILGS